MLRSAGLALIAAVALSAASPAFAQQRVDPNADVSVIDPAFVKGTGPVIAIDSGHREFNTVRSGYGPLAALLGNDGYVVLDYADALTPTNLAKLKVLLIAEPMSPDRPASKSPYDTLSAFSADEIKTLHDWVAGGGALMLVSDHPPYIGGLRDLAQAFGFTYNRYAASTTAPLELFTRANGGLIDGPLTAGVDQFQTFFGTAFTAPPGATALLKLDSSWSFGIKLPVPIPASSDDWRGASMPVGKGRLIVFGEAGDLGAQISKKDQLMGFNAPQATGNKRMIRNMIRWLATGETPALPPVAAPPPANDTALPGVKEQR